MRGTCVKCGRGRNLTKHHLFPKSIRKLLQLLRAKTTLLGIHIWLCRACHAELETLIPKRKVLHFLFYIETAERFLGREFIDLDDEKQILPDLYATYCSITGT